MSRGGIREPQRGKQPVAGEIAGRARRIAGAMRDAGSNTVVDERGRFIDPAVVANAEVVLALADALVAHENRTR